MPVRVTLDGRSTFGSLGETLFSCADKIGTQLSSSCKQRGSCRECLVIVTGGGEHLSAKTASEDFLREGFRLACQASVVDDDGAIDGRTLRHGRIQIIDSGMHQRVKPVATTLKAEAKKQNGGVNVRGAVLPDLKGTPYGLAIDAGTTTVVIRLIDLDTGEFVASQAFENPQLFAGTDVMARIAYDADDGHSRQQKALAATINQAIKFFECDYRSIVDVVIVGNTTMRDLLFGLDVQPIGQRPYRSTIEEEQISGIRKTTNIERPARSIGLMVNRKAHAYGLPLLGSHVGADAAACISALAMDQTKEVVVLMDIGTNTEIVIGNGKRFMAASCPAGPAFEGRGITCGMPAFEGAIEQISVSDDGVASFDTIGGTPAQGICGSGLISLLGELRRTGRMTELGRLNPAADRFFVDTNQDIYITERDISELAQAKGAHWAGLILVTRAFGIDLNDISRLYLAGGFAQHIDIGHAQRMGLIPNIDPALIEVVGNVAIEGASEALVSTQVRRQIETLAIGVEHVELETAPDFFDIFVEGCQFKPMSS